VKDIISWHRKSDPRLAQYEDLKNVIAMLGLEQLSLNDRKVVSPRPEVREISYSAVFATEQFSGIKGKLVSLKDSLMAANAF